MNEDQWWREQRNERIMFGIFVAVSCVAALLFCAAFYDLKPVHPFQAVGEIYERTD